MQRNKNRAALPDAKCGNQELCAVGQNDRDPLAWPYSGGAKIGRKEIDPVEQFSVCEASRAGNYRRLIGQHCRDKFELLKETVVERHLISSRSHICPVKEFDAESPIGDR